MTKKIRVGLIGAGNIGQNAHIPAYLKQEDVELFAVYDIKESRSRDVAKRFGFKHVATSLDEIVSMDELDAVSVCTWNNGHAESVIAAANAGKHILCEKPMAMTVAETEEMAKAVRANDVIFMMGFVNRFRAESKVIKALAEEGKFGDIYYAKTGIIRRRGTPLGWFTDLSKSGGGPVIDLGVHVIDVTWYYMGKPKPISVSAVTYSKIGDYKTKGVSRWEAYDTDDLVFDTEDSAAALIRFENGASMTVDVSWAINGQERNVYSEIYGTKAGASLDPFMIYGEEAGYLTDNRPVLEGEDMFGNQIRHFIDCVKTGNTPIATLEDGMEIQKILNGIYESARLGKEIQL
ncbi:MAG: Gfo/Idh/MocA family oxidoreductase [Firmicutes bacterium]|jgi:predicted dehydrogenase|nr:Gfo/Idh/MocA family oxidoreductase [Bacillota bacterium]